MEVKCTCGGLENCKRCFGSGQYTRFQDGLPKSASNLFLDKIANSSSFSLSKGKVLQPKVNRSGKQTTKRSQSRKASVFKVDAPILFEKFLSCPKCPEEHRGIAARNIRKHLVDTHKIRGKQKLNELLHLAKRETAVGRASSFQGFTEFLGSAEDLSPGTDPRDGSKNFGFPAREGSQYGSHSSHDSFDDESSAD